MFDLVVVVSSDVIHFQVPAFGLKNFRHWYPLIDGSLGLCFSYTAFVPLRPLDIIHRHTDKSI